MMLALGVGGWVAGLFHLITHAFFKSLLFLCSGSVIHAVPHERHARRWAACGRRCRSPPTRCSSAAWRSSAPAFRFVDRLQRLLLEGRDPRAGARATPNDNGGGYWLFFVLPLVGAAITAFYMFRLWFMTFAGEPRDHHRYDHAHESPPVMTCPLVLLAVFAVGVGWPIPLTDSQRDEPARASPAGRHAGSDARRAACRRCIMPDEHDSHAPAIHIAGRRWSAVRHGAGRLPAGDGVLPAGACSIRRRSRQQFQPIYTLPVEQVVLRRTVRRRVRRADACSSSRRIAEFDRKVIDGFIDGSPGVPQACVARASTIVIDRYVVDGLVNYVRRLDLGPRPVAAQRADRPAAAVRDVHRRRHGRAVRASSSFCWSYAAGRRRQPSDRSLEH